MNNPTLMDRVVGYRLSVVVLVLKHDYKTIPVSLNWKLFARSEKWMSEILLRYTKLELVTLSNLSVMDYTK